MLSESIFNGINTIIPMEEVSHIDKIGIPKDETYFTKKIEIITSKTKYNYEKDCYENSITLTDSNKSNEASDFIKAYCNFRYEKDIQTKEI